MLGFGRNWENNIREWQQLYRIAPNGPGLGTTEPPAGVNIISPYAAACVPAPVLRAR